MLFLNFKQTKAIFKNRHEINPFIKWVDLNPTYLLGLIKRDREINVYGIFLICCYLSDYIILNCTIFLTDHVV